MRKQNRLHSGLYVLLLTTLLLSCTKDNLPTEQPEEPKQTNGKTLLSFTIAASPITRSAQGPFDDDKQPSFDAISSIMVIAADKQANIIDHSKLTPTSTSGSGYECSIKLMPSDSTYLYFIANSAKAEALMDGSAAPKNIAELTTSDIIESSSSDSGVTSIVMWQKLGLAGGQTTITDPVKLIRLVGRLKIKYNNPYQEIDSIKIQGTAEKGSLFVKKSSFDGFKIVDKDTRIGGGGVATSQNTYYYYVYPTSEELKVTCYIGDESRLISLGDKVEANKSYSLEILYDSPVVSHSGSDEIQYSPANGFTSSPESNDITLTVLPGTTAYTDNPSWITIRSTPETRSTQYGTITITLSSNETEASRSGIVTIKNGTRKVIFPITQERPTIRKDGQSRIIMGTPTGYAYNIVILGDGFTHEDNVVDGEYDKQVQKIINFVFSIEPFKAYKEYFRIYQVYAESQERGADLNSSEDKVNTIFNSSYGGGGIDRLLGIRNSENVEKYAAKATSDINLYLIIVNSQKYGGSGGRYIVTSVHPTSPEIALHEIGHGFGLTDEYADANYVASTGITQSSAASEPNASLTSDLSTIKWKHFIGRKGYEIEGAYEGCHYFTTGVWRPSYQSIMRTLSFRYYNAISRETIVRRILSKVHIPFDMDNFYKRDVTPSTYLAPFSLQSHNEMPPPTELYYDYATGKYKF